MTSISNENWSGNDGNRMDSPVLFGQNKPFDVWHAHAQPHAHPHTHTNTLRVYKYRNNFTNTTINVHTIVNCMIIQGLEIKMFNDYKCATSFHISLLSL